MKKSIIAGASVLALAGAVMPFAGVFAAANPSDLVDTIKVTIEESCTWTRTLATTDAEVTVANGTSASASASRTMTAGQTIETFATSTINAKCNNDKGYKITGTFTNLGGYTSSTKATVITDNIAYDATLAAGKWTASLGGTGLVSGTAGNVATTEAGDNMSDGSEYVVTYGVQTDADQSAGYYEGTATYVFAQNS